MSKYIFSYIKNEITQIMIKHLTILSNDQK